MKKLLVAAMGIAAAYGAFADPFSVGKRFEDLTVDATVTTNELNEAAGGTFWTDPVGATNTYTVKTMDAYGGSRPAFFPVAPNKALEVKTTFGSPLKFNFKEGDTQTIGDDGLYFDSLVKFTVCDAAPEDKDAYSGAKIMLWLQSDDDTVTNVMIRAGYLTYSAGTVSSVATNYTCGTVDGDFAESWHRVTIKAIADITADDDVPGFVVFIDEAMVIVPLAANYNVWGDGFPARTDNAGYWEKRKALFPSIVQTSDKKLFSAVEFDGTGFLNDVTVTETAPDFAKDQEAPKAEVTINGEPVEEDVNTIADAVNVINSAKYAGGTAELTLLAGVTLDAPIVFTGAGATTIELDFTGFVLTNELDMAAITNSAVTLIVTNSSVGVGGIYCSDANGGAIATVGGATTINDGWFYGNITVENASLAINGGCFKQGYQALKSYMPKTKVTEVVQAMGLTFNKVVDYVPEVYTITFNTMGGVFADPTEATQEVTEGNYVQKPTDPTKSGATFVKWVWDHDDDGGETPMVEFIFDGDPEEREPTEVSDNLELFAEWEAIPTYTITFVYGLTGEYSVQQIGIQAGETPELPAEPETQYAIVGYNIAWPTFAPASASVTYTATYTGKTFTIYTCTNGVVNTSKEFTYAGASVAPADPTFNSETEEWDGKWYISNGSSTEFAFNPAGELTQYAYATITAKSGGGVPDIPAGGETDCGTAEAAAAAADAINKDAASKAAHIKVPTGAVAETYLGYVEAVAVGTKVKVDFSEAGAAVAQTSANNDVVSEAVSAAVAAAAAAGSEGSGTASVSTVAGFYYSIVSGTSPTAVTTEGTRVLGTGGSVNLTVPNKGPAGFYKVKVSARSAD